MNVIGFVYVLVIIFFKIYLCLFSTFEYVMHFFEAQCLNNYDYVIVGCGTAGSLIAHYLEKKGDVNFLVIEAGGYGGPLLNPPSVGPLLQKTVHDWQYKTTPQKNACLAMNQQECSWPMGKIIGGSGKLNNMVHINGYIDEISTWFNETYTMLELNRHLEEIQQLDLQYSNITFKTRMSEATLEAAKEMGYRVKNADKMKSGFAEPLFNVKDGSRWSTSHSLLEHGLYKGRIMTHAHVEKILFDPSTNTANGVIFERYGIKSTVRASKGIIMASGAIGTPKLLMLSGIGPKEHLESLGITVIKDLPVGKNLVDHVTTGLDLLLLNETSDFTISHLLNPISMLKYLTNGNGSWTASGCEVLALLNTKLDGNSKECETCGSPDLQLMMLPAGISTDYGSYLRYSFGISDIVWNNYFSKVTDSFSILPILLHPHSKGVVRLRSNNPNDAPLIDPNYYSDRRDVDIMLEGINIVKSLAKSEAMKKSGIKLNTIHFPGCEANDFDSKDYWECYLRHMTLTTYHPAGTCKMGSQEDESAVINYDFRVKGTQNLYVADASVFPNLPSGNINTAVAMVARILVDLL